MTSLLDPAITGYTTAFSLILAIGAQNAFVLRQGLRGEHVFWISLFCATSDAILITAGVLGFAAIVEAWPAFPAIMRWGGVAFLTVYGILRLSAAMRPSGAMDLAGQAQPLWPALATCAAFTWANPHVYLDTLGLIGAISTAYPFGPEKLTFGIAATCASFTFFFALGYGARLLRPAMQSPRAWQILDGIIGIVMLALAAKLALGS